MDHVLADGTQDAGFSVTVSGGAASVTELAYAGGTLYLGGDFTAINGAVRPDIGAVDVTGAVTGFVPAFDGPISDLATHGGPVYVAGAFTTANGAPRAGLAALAPASGSTLPFNPNAQNVALPGPGVSVGALWLAGTTLYAGGHFDRIGGAERAGLAALDTTQQGGDATAWAPDVPGFPGDTPYAILRMGSTVYVSVVDALAAFDASSGDRLAGFDPVVRTRAAFTTLAAGGGRLFAGGGNVLDETADEVVSLDPVQRVPPTPTSPSPATRCSASRSPAAGSSSPAPPSVGGVRRGGLAALDAATLAPEAWNPGGGRFSTLLVDDAGLFVSNVGSVFGQARNGIARFDPDTLALDPWNPEAPFGCGVRCVGSMAVSGDRLIVGGEFTTFAGQPAAHLVALSLGDGTRVPFGPGADGQVRALLAAPGGVYLGGDFTHAGGQSRNRLAALDPVTGLATPFDPDMGGRVDALTSIGDTLYAGGSFDRVGGTVRNGVAAFDMASAGTPLLPFAPAAGIEARALAGSVSSLYRAGFGQGAAIADLNPVTGSARAWDPQIGGDPVFVPVAVAAVGDRLLASGVRGGVTGARPSIRRRRRPIRPRPAAVGGGSGGQAVRDRRRSGRRGRRARIRDPRRRRATRSARRRNRGRRCGRWRLACRVRRRVCCGEAACGCGSRRRGRAGCTSSGRRPGRRAGVRRWRGGWWSRVGAGGMALWAPGRWWSG